MKAIEFTNVPELAEFFNIRFDDFGSIDIHAHCEAKCIEWDLERMILLITRRTALKEDLSEDDIQRLQEVLNGTLKDLQNLRKAVTEYVVTKAKE